MKDKYKSLVKSIIEMIVCAIIVLVIFKYLVIPIRIQGSSMENYLHEGDIAFINAIGSHNGNVNRFDVVVLYSSDLDEKIIKRVIGLSGDHIVYKDDQLYVNGEAVDEYFLDDDYKEYAKKQYNNALFTDDFEVTVGENEIFVLGDNRLGSTDSRVLGCFSYDDIIGKKGIVLYPFKDIKWID